MKSGWWTAIVVLAAGPSSRLGRPKQLLTYRGKSLLRHAAEEALATGCDPVVVVLGAQFETVVGELSGLPVVVCRNEEWPEGMSSSLRAGLRVCLERDVALPRVLFMLCDQPAVDRIVLERLLRMHAEGDSSATACSVQGRAQVPAIFEREYFEDLLALTGDRGARAILRRGGGRVTMLVSLPELQDVDTVEDLDRLEGPEKA